MVLAHLHRFYFPTLLPKPQSLSTAHSLFPTPPLSKLLNRPRYSTLLAAEPPPAAEPASAAEPLDPRIEIPLDRLFVPPDTDVPRDSSDIGVRVLKGSNIVLSRYARDAQVAEAEFVKSSVRTEDCPSDGLPEFALVGRSNVGKSSLLNSLVRRKKLALISKKPGWFSPKKMRTVNNCIDGTNCHGMSNQNGALTLLFICLYKCLHVKMSFCWVVRKFPLGE